MGDVFTQLVYRLGATFLVGLIGGGLGTLLGVLIGFTAGYRNGDWRLEIGDGGWEIGV